MKHARFAPLLAALLGLLGVLAGSVPAWADEVVPSAVDCRWIVRPLVADAGGATVTRFTPERYLLRSETASAAPEPDGTGWTLTSPRGVPAPVEYDVADIATGKVVFHGTVQLPCVAPHAIDPPRYTPGASASPCRWGKHRGRCAASPLFGAVLVSLASSGHVTAAMVTLIEQERDPGQRGTLPVLPVLFGAAGLGEAVVAGVLWDRWTHPEGLVRAAPSVSFTREGATVGLSGRF